ncbi:VTT domain-containing protein [Bacillus shivajii]|uniref:TVP38/TMEM64 family protein n=1 Tax=Bacillus shivajii TaxID=1983719 RepID=UPI001CFB664D|nr:VTT domain-containing protein [Bacillus shivajii]UCZ51578.1 VTT domain-containing protein [Bacillus shivajii]
MKRAILFLLFIVIVFFFIDSEWFTQLRNENVEYFTDELFAEMGYQMLLVTLPLITLQGTITFFPIIIVIIIHFLAFGLIEGFIFSVIGTSFGAIFCYWLSRSFSEQYVKRMKEKNTKKINKIMRVIANYGVFIIVVLRSLPFMPSNLISIAAAFSPISFRHYVISTVLGNISMVWILSIFAMPVWYTGTNGTTYVFGYLVFAILLFSMFAVYFFKFQKEVNKRKSISIDIS